MDSKTRAFLTKILKEPSFRELAEKDTVQALADVGISATREELPKQINLPSNDEIEALLLLDKPLERLKSCLSVFHVCGWPNP